jgi:hypothetical protein
LRRVIRRRLALLVAQTPFSRWMFVAMLFVFVFAHLPQAHNFRIFAG